MIGSDRVLSATGISHRFYSDGPILFGGLDLKLQHSEILGVVGPSGCGKSTLLRVISGLLKPTEGHISFHQGILESAGFVFQTPALLPWLSTRRNLEFFAASSSDSSVSSIAEVDEALLLVGLKEFQDYYPSELSGGMQMRLSLARALLRRPKVLFMDEPLSALDELTRHQLQLEIYGLQQRQKFAGILVTHSLWEATFLCPRILILDRSGRLVKIWENSLGRELRDAQYFSSPDFFSAIQSLSKDFYEVNQT